MKSYPSPRQELITMFIDRNSKINLSAIRNPDEIYQKHIVDALELLKIFSVEKGGLKAIFDKDDVTACDVGTGGGFPLLPLALTYSNINRTGIDARKKKLTAINDIIKKLGINNYCTTKHIRIEEHKDKYDIITARAVAYSDKLLPWINSISNPGTIIILYKLFTTEEDRYLKKHPREILLSHPYKLLNDDVPRIIYVLKKPK